MPNDDIEDDATVKGRQLSGPSLISRSGEAVKVEQCAFGNVRFETCDLTGAQFANVVIQPGVSFDSRTLFDAYAPTFDAAWSAARPVEKG
ncbi:hypothetical protein [Kitasatospora sp. NPDC089509]|uniref:hypothetical protein n=1 Tax=Kitasatospora sp. NPDC089509 TaxID=3364079 RepID=UPI0037F98515